MWQRMLQSGDVSGGVEVKLVNNTGGGIAANGLVETTISGYPKMIEIASSINTVVWTANIGECKQPFELAAYGLGYANKTYTSLDTSAISRQYPVIQSVDDSCIKWRMPGAADSYRKVEFTITITY